MDLNQYVLTNCEHESNRLIGDMNSRKTCYWSIIFRQKYKHNIRLVCEPFVQSVGKMPLRMCVGECASLM